MADDTSNRLAEVYTLSENSDQSIRAMLRWLTISFLMLVLRVVFIAKDTVALSSWCSNGGRFVGTGVVAEGPDQSRQA